MNKLIKQEHPVITISGKNGSGKSHLINYILASIKYDFVMIFSNTAIAKDYRLKNFKILSPINFESDIEEIMQIQKRDNPKRLKKICIIFDDIMGMIPFNSSNFQVLTSQNRHFNATLLFSIQYIKKTPPYMREISSYDISFGLKSDLSLKGAYENYFARAFDNYDDFVNIMRKLQPYEFLFVDEKGDYRIMKAPKKIYS